MDFILGCNYWASNAGIEMWRDFDAKAIEKDLKILSEHGVECMRVFPLWRDFQPIKPNIGCSSKLSEYVMENGSLPQNQYFLDEEMFSRFETFLDICDKYGIRLVVGLITGWMSGGLFIPTALYNKNVLTDPVALYFEQLFIKGFVNRFKNRKTIYAWDLGNECNCMAETKDRFEAVSWAATISNAIHAADPERAVVSGMHSLTLDGNWRIGDQAEFTDILTTHPYPLWCKHTTMDEMLSVRTTMHATAQTKWYSDIGNKPCIAEEIGTMGPMVCSDENAANFMRLNLFSLWANGAGGVMWWCNHDQNELKTFPYSVNMIEQELGLVDKNEAPKPALKEIKKFSEFLKENNIDLPKVKEDGVCLLTKGVDHWGVSYMTYILAKEIGLNLRFSYAYEQELPDSNLYIMPSISGMGHMHKATYENLKQKVFDGADLYISSGNAYLEGFEEFVGLKVTDSCICGQNCTVTMADENFTFYRPMIRGYVPITAKVLAETDSGNPFITVNQYGKGRVFFVDAPIENNLIKAHNGFNGKTVKIYETIFAKHIESLDVRVDDKEIAITYHPDEDGGFIVAVNHSACEKALDIKLKSGLEVERVIYGDEKTIKPFNACVINLKKV